MLKGKTVVLAVTGSIAAYKIASLASALKKLHADVHVLMTKNAENFINPITFETLTGNKCLIDTFDRNFQYNVEHVALAKKADVVMVAPASANIIGKIAHGIADDMLTTTVMACRCKIIFAPAMNTQMFENPIVQDNLKTLEHYGCEVISPASGYLACGDTGQGKMPEPELLLRYLKGDRFPERSGGKEGSGHCRTYSGTHRSGAVHYQSFIRENGLCSGKDGHAERGSGYPGVGSCSDYAAGICRSGSCGNCRGYVPGSDQPCRRTGYYHQSSGSGDYRPKTVSQEKVKKQGEDISLEMERTRDILKYLESIETGTVSLRIFYGDREYAGKFQEKLKNKNLDMIVANNLKVEGAGFAGNTNVITMITEKEEVSLEKMLKEEAALKFWTRF